MHAQCMEQGAKASALGQPRGMGGEGGGVHPPWVSMCSPS